MPTVTVTESGDTVTTTTTRSAAASARRRSSRGRPKRTRVKSSRRRRAKVAACSNSNKLEDAVLREIGRLRAEVGNELSNMGQQLDIINDVLLLSPSTSTVGRDGDDSGDDHDVLEPHSDFESYLSAASSPSMALSDDSLTSPRPLPPSPVPHPSSLRTCTRCGETESSSPARCAFHPGLISLPTLPYP
ncbi:uncharacterized protein AMSG_10574 [Thecamonas trahens ATCC 50062]|uniref:Uncharacterized protein n=1 Tax=Thecamonas trahens ATCC 50062 TaxID=461836 RepID=A0A0L0DRK1_THETB|nr:hypothetical protein AMSG_10574 [Thecamonas trahens ATCC 50062]KNC54915.1 hypothetical protein AMSG_10574 [Thecamonas trahens ATCC 50062]|eukprot:XP_013753505.1 hypothetical protein AMSG_10574 [Thecamonas trahens ATCC 50062]